MNEKHLVVYCTCPDQTVADKIAGALVDERLAACVNIIGGITSIYRWEEQRLSEPELLLVIKTHNERYSALEARIRELHPYETPEIIGLPVVRGASDYLAWIDACVGGR